jgi:hypothetical protein
MKHDRSWWAQEIERIVINRKAAWEGKQEQVIDLGNALLKVQPGFGMVMRLHFTGRDIEQRIDETIEQVERIVPRCGWGIGPSSQPADLEQRLNARGFITTLEWDGLVLEDLSTEIPRNPTVMIEPLSWQNAAEYATRCTEVNDAQFHASLLASAHRFLTMPHHEVQIFVARLDEEVAGYAVLRLEPNGVSYLCDAMTVPAFRRRGVYLSLVAHRLKVAEAAGCTTAVILAQTKTSAPILVRHDFIPVCRMVALTRKRSAS